MHPIFGQYDPNFVNSLFSLLDSRFNPEELDSLTSIKMGWNEENIPEHGYGRAKTDFVRGLISKAINNSKLQQLANFALAEKPDFGYLRQGLDEPTANHMQERYHLDIGTERLGISLHQDSLNILLEPCLKIISENKPEYIQMIASKLDSNYPKSYNGISRLANSAETLVRACHSQSRAWNINLYNTAKEVCPQFEQLYKYSYDKLMQKNLFTGHMAEELKRLQGVGRST